tara:strand:+ start:2702 stop:2923 length:222 start_codon:yes stop_codon:yes gene_type:complete
MKSEKLVIEKSKLVDHTRKMLIAHLHDNKKSLLQFSKEVGIHQPNLYVFMNGKGLSIKSLEKLWVFFGFNLIV